MTASPAAPGALVGPPRTRGGADGGAAVLGVSSRWCCSGVSGAGVGDTAVVVVVVAVTERRSRGRLLRRVLRNAKLEACATAIGVLVVSLVVSARGEVLLRRLRVAVVFVAEIQWESARELADNRATRSRMVERVLQEFDWCHRRGPEMEDMPL